MKLIVFNEKSGSHRVLPLAGFADRRNAAGSELGRRRAGFGPRSCGQQRCPSSAAAVERPWHVLSARSVGQSKPSTASSA